MKTVNIDERRMPSCVTKGIRFRVQTEGFLKQKWGLSIQNGKVEDTGSNEEMWVNALV